MSRPSRPVSCTVWEPKTGMVFGGVLQAFLQHSAACGADGRVGAMGVEQKFFTYRPGDSRLCNDNAEGEAISDPLGHHDDVRDVSISLKAPHVITGAANI